jgi:uncharacterized protein (DUF169 family)
MESRITKELKLRFEPVAVIFSAEKPEGALEFKEDERGCVIAMLTAASRGKIAVLGRQTVGCPGGAIGLALKDSYAGFPGGIEYFLSTGRGEGYPEGEAYKKTPDDARGMVEHMPHIEGPSAFVVFKPLSMVDPAKDKPETIVFYCNPDQLSAMVVLANYDRPDNDNVMIPMGSGCQSICLYPADQRRQDRAKAVVGLIDISARPQVDADILTFTVPYERYLEMEANVPGSFLEKHDWKKVRERIPDPKA